MYVNDSISVWSDEILEVAEYPALSTNTTQGFFLRSFNNTELEQESCADSTGKLVLEKATSLLKAGSLEQR